MAQETQNIELGGIPIQELPERSNYSLKKEIKRLTAMLVTVDPTTPKHQAILERIKTIEQIRTIRTTAKMNVAKTFGWIGLSGASLYMTYKIADNGDSPINRETGRFASGLRNLFKL